MEDILKQINRELIVDGIQLSAEDIISKYEEGEVISITIKANNIVQQQPEANYSEEEVDDLNQVPIVGKTYIMKVKQYMTKPSSPSFDFQEKWNKNVPMPFRIMICEVTKETRGMVYVSAHAEPLETSSCIKCGRTLTNPISKLYGLGPECGSHAYLNPFNTEEELKEHMDEVYANLAEITWEGWIIKSAIQLCQEVK